MGLHYLKWILQNIIKLKIVLYYTCLISEEEVAAAIKGLKIGKATGPTGVVSEMMKAAGGFGSRWMTDLINNLVKEDYIPND